MGQILLAGEEPQECPALPGDLVADGAAQHRIAGFERVEHRALRDRTLYLKLHVAANLRQRSQMLRKPLRNKSKVNTSRLATAKRPDRI